jgi:gliding motility-associated-like protein
MRYPLLVVLFISIFFSQASAQIDQEFWFGAPDLTQGTQGEINGNAFRDRPIQVVISTLTDPAQITIWQPANLSFAPIVVNLGPSSTQTVNLTAWLNQIETREIDSVMNTGILIRSTAPITAYYELGAAANRDLIALKGKNGNGTLFFTPFQTEWENDQSLNSSPYIPAPRSGFVIVATDDSTTVTITPAIDILNHLAGVPFSIYLHRGQTYYCEALDQTALAKPAGTKIESDRPIAVTIKDDMIDLNLATDGGADLAADQLISVDKCGFKHIVVRGDLGSPGDKVYVLATEDGTDIFIDGSAVPVTTLNTGQQYTYNFTAAAGFIRGNKPIYVLHISGVGDQIAGAIIPSLECTGSNQVGFTRTGNANFKMNLTIKAGSESSFLLNGNASLITAADFQPVPGSNGVWVFMRKAFSTAEIPVGQGALLQNFSDELFHMGITYQQGASCNYGYFTNFSYLELGINQELCLGDSAILDAGPGKTEYLWSTGDTTQKIIVFDAGTYWCSTLSGNECVAIDTVTVNYYAPPVNIQASRDTICEGSQLLLSVPGVYLFEWQDGSTDPFLIASDSGLYTVTVTDYQGCRAVDSIRIYTSPRPITPTAVILPFDATIDSDTLCEGESVELRMQSLEGANYAWLGPNNTIFTGEQLLLNNITIAQSGEYKAFYTVSGCESYFDTLNISVNPSPEVYIGLSDTLCDVQDLLLDAGAGIGYTYLWQDASTNQTFTVNQNGEYFVEVTNELGCSRRDTVSLTFSVRPPAPVLSVNGQDILMDSLCAGQALNLNVPALSGSSYFWVAVGDTTSSVSPNFNLTDLAVNQSGIYSTFYYVNGCPSLSDTVEITVLESPVFDFSFSDSTICGSTPVLLSAATVTGVIYQWQDNSTNSDLLASVSGDYWVKLTNSIGCTSVDSVTITFNPFPQTPQISGELSICNGSDLVLSANNEAGVVYFWNGPGYANSAGTITIPNMGDSNAGEYSLAAILNGCKSLDSAFAQVEILALPAIDLGDDLTICKGSFVTVTGPSEMAAYAWSNETEEQSASLSAGSYTLIVKDNNGCENLDAITISELGPVAAFSSDPTTGAQTGVAISFTDASQGSPVIWNWAFGDNAGAQTQNTSHAFDQQGVLKVTLIVRDAAGCSDTTSRDYTISNSVAVPNSFTPNGDGKNDFFVIKGLEAFPDSRIMIFNRWGSEIYSSNGYVNNWEAANHPDGVYFYILELSNGEKLKGDVTIVRQ